MLTPLLSRPTPRLSTRPGPILAAVTAAVTAALAVPLSAACSLLPIGAPAVAGATPTPSVDRWGDFGSDGPVTTPVVSPTPVNGLPANITQISATNSDTYVLTNAGAVWVFGAGQNGELGDGTTADSFTTPVQVKFPSGVKIASLPSPMPFDTGLAIDTTGHVWGWGANRGSELCLGAKRKETLPTELPLTSVTVATGAGEHATYDAGGALVSCGDNQFGELGTGDTAAENTPTAVQGLPHVTVTSLTSSFGGTGALLADGTYWDWGLNARGQLGDGAVQDRSLPVEVSLPSAATQVVEGGNTSNDGQTLALLANGGVEAWGSDQFAQLCDGAHSNGVVMPEQIHPPTGVQWLTLASGGGTSYAIDGKGGLWSCGDNRDGEVGNGVRSGTPVATPTQVLSGVTAVSATSRNVAAELQ